MKWVHMNQEKNFSKKDPILHNEGTQSNHRSHKKIKKKRCELQGKQQKKGGGG